MHVLRESKRGVRGHLGSLMEEACEAHMCQGSLREECANKESENLQK